MIEALLDTHILAWWLTSPEMLSPHQGTFLGRIEESGGLVAISCITLWELSMLIERNRIRLDRPPGVWLEELERSPLLVVLPITARIAVDRMNLGRAFPHDPADQLIASTARNHALPLITSDRAIRASGCVVCV